MAFCSLMAASWIAVARHGRAARLRIFTSDAAYSVRVWFLSFSGGLATISTSPPSFLNMATNISSSIVPSRTVSRYSGGQ